jgi:putative endonuclease
MGKTQDSGKSAEEFAYAYLKKQGLKFVARNYTCRFGEIDLIMQDKEFLIFVEVRYRKNKDFGGSLESVNFHKQKKILRAASCYLQEKNLFEKVPVRFDVVGITAAQIHLPDEVQWLKNAFSLDFF